MPDSQPARLKSLADLFVLYTPAEERFDRITRTIGRILDMPIAFLSLIGGESEWFKSLQGLSIGETPLPQSLGVLAIESGETTLIPDTKADARTASHPWVVGEPGIGFYMAHPVRSPDGIRVGTIGAMDRVPRSVTPTQVAFMRDMAIWAESELKNTALDKAQQELIHERDDLRRKAMLDPLLQVWTREMILQIMDREVQRAQRGGRTVGVILLDVDGFSAINEKLGRAMGDEVLRDLVQRIRVLTRPYDALGRWGADEFMVVMDDCCEEALESVAERIQRNVAVWPLRAGGKEVHATICAGAVSTKQFGPHSGGDFIGVVEAQLQRARSQGPNHVEFALHKSAA